MCVFAHSVTGWSKLTRELIPNGYITYLVKLQNPVSPNRLFEFPELE